MNAKEIIQLLETPTPDRRPTVRQITEEAAIPELIKALQEATTPLTREILCDILGTRADKRATSVLIDALHDPTPAVRGSAADALAKVEDPQAGPALMEQYSREEGDDGIRQLIAIALGAVNYQPAVPYLIQALSSSSEILRLCAAWALKDLRAQEAKQPLEQALEHETDSYTVDEMKKALMVISSSH